MLFITGGAGFIGSGLIAALNERGEKDILVVDHLGSDNKWMHLQNKLFADYCDKDSFIEKLNRGGYAGQKCKAIIHLGACSRTTETDTGYLMKNNTLYTRDLAHYALKAGIPFYYASSAATYGDGSLGFTDDESQLETLHPRNMYGFSKHLFDLWARDYGWLKQITGFKFFNVFGPNEDHKTGMTSIVYNAYHQICTQGEVQLFASDHPEYENGEQLRDFVYVKDVVGTLLWFLDHPEHKGLYNLGFGQAVSWKFMTHLVFEAMGMEPKIRYIPMPENLQKKYQYHTFADMQKTDSLCPLKRSPMASAVQDYVQNYLLKEKSW